MKNLKNFNFTYVFIVFLFLLLGIIAYYNKTNNIDVKQLGVLPETIINPQIIQIITQKNNIHIPQVLIIDNQENHQLYNNIFLFNLRNNRIKTVSKGNLKGKFQNYYNLPHTANQFINVKLIKENSDDVCGIDIFDVETNKWTKLKTNLILRKNSQEKPFIDVLFINNTPLLLVWGGINYKTNTYQNTLEVVDILNDKLLEKRTVNFKGGRFITPDDQRFYIVGAQINNNDTDSKEIKIQNKNIELLQNEDSNPLLFAYTKLMTNTLSSSLDRRTILAVSIKNDILTEYSLPKGIDAANSLEIETIPIPSKFKNYKIIDVIHQSSKIFLIMSNQKTSKEIIVQFSNMQDVHKKDSQDYRFNVIGKINSDISLKNAVYYRKTLTGDNTTFITVKDNNVLEVNLK